MGMSKFESGPGGSGPYDQNGEFGFISPEDAAKRIQEIVNKRDRRRVFLMSETYTPELCKAASWLRASGLVVVIPAEN